MHIHFGQGDDQALIAEGVALGPFGGELAAPVPRHQQLELVNAGDEVTAVVAGPVSVPAFGSFSRQRPLKFGHFASQGSLQCFRHQSIHQVAVARDRFYCGQLRSTLFRGHGCPPKG